MAEINTQGLKRTVQFDDNVHTILIAYEDRKGEWMNYAIDRAHFKRRIHQMEMILVPILKKKLSTSIWTLCKMSVSYSWGCILKIKDIGRGNEKKEVEKKKRTKEIDSSLSNQRPFSRPPFFSQKDASVTIVMVALYLL